MCLHKRVYLYMWLFICECNPMSRGLLALWLLRTKTNMTSTTHGEGCGIGLLMLAPRAWFRTSWVTPENWTKNAINGLNSEESQRTRQARPERTKPRPVQICNPWLRGLKGWAHPERGCLVYLAGVGAHVRSCYVMALWTRVIRTGSLV